MKRALTLESRQVIANFMDLYKFGSFLSAISILDRFVGQNHPLVFTHPCVLGGKFPTKTLVYGPKGVIRQNSSFPH